MKPLVGYRYVPKSVCVCGKCGEDIFPGDEYAKIGDMIYCETCIDDMTKKELVAELGGEWRTADENDIDDGSDDAYESWRDEVAFG